METNDNRDISANLCLLYSVLTTSEPFLLCVALRAIDQAGRVLLYRVSAPNVVFCRVNRSEVGNLNPQNPYPGVSQMYDWVGR